MKKAFIIAMAISMFAATNVMAHCGQCGVGAAKNEEGKPKCALCAKGLDCAKCGKKGAMTEEEIKAHIDAKMEKLTEKLELNDDQQVQIQTIMEEKWEKKMAIKAEKRAKMDALYEETKAKVNAVLNEEQQAKHEEMIKEWKESKKGSKKGSDKGSHKGSDKGSHKGSHNHDH